MLIFDQEVLMIKTMGVYHIGIPCNDVDRAVRFYTEILGMTPYRENEAGLYACRATGRRFVQEAG